MACSLASMVASPCDFLLSKMLLEGDKCVASSLAHPFLLNLAQVLEPSLENPELSADKEDMG